MPKEPSEIILTDIQQLNSASFVLLKTPNQIQKDSFFIEKLQIFVNA